MPIIARIGPAATKIFWALFALFGVILISSGFFNSFAGLTNFGSITLANAAALSHVSGGIVMFIIGFVMAAAAYQGIRRTIIITISDETKAEF